MLGLTGKRVQINPGDTGRYDMVEGIRLGLDREYPDWKSPKGTHMVPDFIPSDQRDKGKIAEESVHNLLQKCGTQRKEPMFVVHSCPFSEHIPDSKRQKSWVMGETDFVIIHKIHGPIYIEVKATETGKSFKEAEEQLQKGKLALQKHFEKAVKGEIKTRKVIEIFKNLPAFVAMPNCPRPSEVCALKANALYKEDCSSLEAFDKWWNDNVVTAKHPAVDQKIYEDLVIWFVGMSCLKPLGFRLNDDDRTMIFQTQQQMKILAGNYSPVLWIRGPAGSGKTHLLIEKAVTLAEDVVFDHSKANEKILVLCFNSVLCKALKKTIEGYLHIPEGTDVSSFVHFKTFTKLVMELAHLSEPPNNHERDESVKVALENVKATNGKYMYDHILVDEAQDLYGKEWPKLLKHMHRNLQFAKEGILAKPGFFWVMYDMNQYLYFKKEQASSQFSKYLFNSAGLNQVFRNTDCVFRQSQKYYKSSMKNDSPITLGHAVSGVPITWDESLAKRSGEEKEGAKKVIQWIAKLQNQKVHLKDISILVENEEKKKILQHEMECFGEKTQTGDDLVEKSRNCVVLETSRRFKGLESKVVILYNPPFQDDPSICTKELLYTAVSRCSCYLVVISTQEGCKALKSDVGVTEESRGRRPHTSWLKRPASVLQSQQQGNIHDAGVSPQKSGRSLDEGHFKQLSDLGDYEGVSISDLSRSSPDQLDMYMHHQRLSEKRAVSNEPRPKEVDGSNLIEPGDPNITDVIRGKAFTLLEEVVQENLKFIPDVDTMDLTTIVAAIEYKAYQKRRAECRPHNFTADLRKLKKEISACNKKEICHDCVMNALESATKIRGEG